MLSTLRMMFMELLDILLRVWTKIYKSKLLVPSQVKEVNIFIALPSRVKEMNIFIALPNRVKKKKFFMPPPSQAIEK